MSNTEEHAIAACQHLVVHLLVQLTESRSFAKSSRHSFCFRFPSRASMIASLVNAAELLEPYSPQVPTDQLIVALNRWYHEHEVKTYDQEHTEIRHQLPPLWEAMVATAVSRHSEQPWRILNFGCGTGFEASLLLQLFVPDSIVELWCYDLSPEMLEICEATIGPKFPKAHFVNSLDQLPSDGRFNLLATNSVLHHLPSPSDTLQSILPHLSDSAIWLAGHEPSGRFYKNPNCCASYRRFLQSHRRRRWISPSAYLSFALRKTGFRESPAQAAAIAAVDAGMLERRPSLRVVSRLVDLHVAHSSEEAEAGRGFDIDEMTTHFSDTWELCSYKTYSFMGSFYEGGLSRNWQTECRRLAAEYPRDGANFCSVWQRC